LNPTLQKSGLKKGDKIRIPGTESNQNLAVFFVEPIKETQKNTVPEKIVQKRRSELLLKSNETKEPTSEVVVREILPQETKYSIAKQYKITVAELDAANPILERSFKIGQKNHYTCKKEKQCTHCCCPKEIRKEVMLKETIVADKPSPKNDAVTILSPIVDGSALETEVIREVLAKETKYGIAKEYGFQ
jgi:LysM repeat protein